MSLGAVANPPAEGHQISLPPSLPGFFSHNSVSYLGSSLTDCILSATPPPSYSFPWEDQDGSLLQENFDFQLPYLQDPQPTINPWDTYCAGGCGQSLPPPDAPPLVPQTPSDITEDVSSPFPSTPSSSDSRSSEHQHRCKRCGKTFKKGNDLKRHTSTVHGGQNASTNRYKCSCGYNCPRKDNYLRHHLGSRRQRSRCNKVAEQVSPRHPFECYCSRAECSASAHLQHVAGCTTGHHGPPGRPRRST